MAALADTLHPALGSAIVMHRASGKFKPFIR